MKKYPFVLLMMFLCAFFVHAQNDRVQFGHLSVKDGLSQLSVISLFQDSQGFMWLGTRDGLNKYDGYNFHIYRDSDKDNYISNSFIECIAEDEQNRLWVGTRRGLNRYDADVGHFVPYYHSADNDSTISDNVIILTMTHFYKKNTSGFWK